MDVERLLAQEEAGWRSLGEAFARVPSGRFEEPTLTPEGWSPKDAMFHVAGWLSDCAWVLDRIRRGTFDRAAEDALDIQTVNDAWFVLSRGMTPDEVRAWFVAARERARVAFVALAVVTPDAWEWFDESGPLHYRKHVEDLEAWLG